MDVLAFTPVYRLEPETIAALMALEHEPLTLMLQRDNPYRRGDGANDGPANHYRQYVRGRELFLAGPWEAMLVIESDVIPPPDTVERLIALDADLAYGAYLFRGNKRPVVNVYERYPADVNGRLARNIGMSLSVRGLWAEALHQGVIECSGAGLGCVLIRRRVLEATPFRMEAGSFCDTPFTRDVYSAGFTMRADCRLHCGHKTPEGEILWPEEAPE